MLPRLALLGGLALFTAVLAWQGAGAVIAAAAAAGWGLAAVTLFHLLPLALDAAGLKVLPGAPPRWRDVLVARWVGESVNGLLPVAQVGGEVVKARLFVLQGCALAPAAAVVIVALTLQAAGQGLFAFAGLAALGARDGALSLPALGAGIGVFCGLIALFYRAQRSGAIARHAARLAGRYGASAEALQRALHALYAQPRAVAASFALLFAGWIAGTGEVWLALRFMGHDVTLVDAVILESLIQAVRGMAFAIPGALGVQEGGLVLLGAMCGVPAPLALALSLVKRVRELALGLPGLLWWQALEGRALRAAAGAAK